MSLLDGHVELKGEFVVFSYEVYSNCILFFISYVVLDPLVSLETIMVLPIGLNKTCFIDTGYKYVLFSFFQFNKPIKYVFHQYLYLAVNVNTLVAYSKKKRD